MRLPAFTGWGYRRDFPHLSIKPFSASKLAKELAPRHSVEASQQKPSRIARVGHSISATPIAAGKPTGSPAAPRPIQSLIGRFTVELTALGGEVVICTADELAERVQEKIRAFGVDRIQTWEAPYLPSGLLESLQKAQIAVSHSADPLIRCGLTGALAGIAETGSLVLPTSQGRSPTASLLPEIHLAVLRAEDIQERLVQALSLPEVRLASSTAIVTGPSRTADIEMTLTIGVHGPGRLIVFVIEGS